MHRRYNEKKDSKYLQGYIKLINSEEKEGYI